jgi:hypothetical protein
LRRLYRLRRCRHIRRRTPERRVVTSQALAVIGDCAATLGVGVNGA